MKNISCSNGQTECNGDCCDYYTEYCSPSNNQCACSYPCSSHTGGTCCGAQEFCAPNGCSACTSSGFYGCGDQCFDPRASYCSSGSKVVFETPDKYSRVCFNQLCPSGQECEIVYGPPMYAQCIPTSPKVK